MGSKEIGGFMVFMLIFSHFCVLALSSSTLQQETLPSDFTQGKNSRDESTHKQSSIGSENPLKHGSKSQSGLGHTTGGGGTRPMNPGENGGNGASHTPAQGGTTLIPVYAAGAVNNRHPSHHGAASCNRMGASTLIAAATASFLLVCAVLKHW